LTRNFAIIPVKGLLDSKGRLSRSLSSGDKQRLIIAMLKDVLTSVQESQLFSQIIVVSPDRNVGVEVNQQNAVFLHQEGPGLNAGIKQSTLVAMSEKASSVAVLLADIPLVEPRDLKELYSVGNSAHKVVLSPSLKGGTNVMVRTPPDIIVPAYGRWSFSTHLRSAQKTEVSVYSVSNHRLSFDVDTAEDLTTLTRRDPHQRTLTARVVQEITSPRVLARTAK
jgi:2-phospho-L-lactate guanylyltransferase